MIQYCQKIGGQTMKICNKCSKELSEYSSEKIKTKDYLRNIEKEIKSLKQLIINNNPSTQNNNYEFDKKNRIKATYNIEKNIKNTLDKYCKSNLKNNSDIVNIALIEFFDKQK